MKTRFFSPSRISGGCRSVLAVAAAGLISSALPVMAQDDIYFPARAASQVSVISQETLDGLLAPIALYPDTLLAQVLMAATYPMDVVEAARWQREHSGLSGQALQDALDSFDWDPSVKSLVTVPQVLQYMNDSPRWMRDLGRAVMDDQPRVMASVQMLRQKAYATGMLVSNDKQTVTVDTDEMQESEYITIAPASPQVVYVPVYDPYVVYGPWWWASRPYYWGPPFGMTFTAGYFWGPYYYPSMALWGGFNWGFGMMTINVPIFTSYYRRSSPPMGRNNSWRRSRSFGGYFSQPSRSPYAGRSSRPSMESGRGPRSESGRGPRSSSSRSGMSPSREGFRGGGGGFHRGGGRSGRR